MFRNQRVAFSGGLILSLALAGTAMGAGNVTAAASGHGSLDSRQFSFSAREFSDGTVSGKATVVNPDFRPGGTAPYMLLVDITCMNDVGDEIYLGGLTQRTNDNLEGAVFFAVDDNGEPGAGLDEISRAYFWDDDPNTVGDPQACEFNVAGDFLLETIDAGNIQVR